MDKKVRRLLDQLQPRAEAFMRHVMHQCTKQGYNEISDDTTVVPSETDSRNSPTSSDYKRNLEVRESSFEDSTYAVCLNQKAAKLPMSEPIILMLRSIYEPPALMVQLMGKFQPFTQYTMPFVPDTRVIRVTYRKTTPEHFERVYQKNLSDWIDIFRVLKEANIVPKLQGDIPKINIYEDLADRIIHREENHPHWKSMANDFRNGKFLKEALDNEKTSRILSDVSYYQWKNLGTGNEEFSRQDEKAWERFQKEILR